MACALNSIAQLVSLLCIPRMLARGAVEQSIVCGWSLGSNVVHMLATFLRSCGMTLHSVLLLEARCMVPKPKRNLP